MSSEARSIAEQLPVELRREAPGLDAGEFRKRVLEWRDGLAQAEADRQRRLADVRRRLPRAERLQREAEGRAERVANTVRRAEGAVEEARDALAEARELEVEAGEAVASARLLVLALAQEEEGLTVAHPVPEVGELAGQRDDLVEAVRRQAVAMASTPLEEEQDTTTSLPDPWGASAPGPEDDAEGSR